MRVLITGGASFIGRHITEYFQDRAEVRALDNLRCGFKSNLSGLKCQFILGSFNVACGRPITITDLALTIRNLTKSRSTIEYAPERPGDVKHSVASMDKIQAAGFRSVCDSAGGLRTTIEFFRKDKAGIKPGRDL